MVAGTGGDLAKGIEPTDASETPSVDEVIKLTATTGETGGLVEEEVV